MVSVYLKTQGLWSYVSGITEEPPVVANPGTIHSGPTSEIMTHKTLLRDYEAAKTKADTWNIEDDKAMGIIALKLTPRMQYLLKKFSKETWENIKKLLILLELLESLFISEQLSTLRWMKRKIHLFRFLSYRPL